MMMDAATARVAVAVVVGAAVAVVVWLLARRRQEPFSILGKGKTAGGGTRAGGTAVGLFVHTWHDLNPPRLRRVMAEGGYAPKAWHWWGRPAWAAGDVAKYTWTDPAMVEYHIDNFIQLGVDFVFLDFTNGNQQGNLDGAHALCAALRQRRAGPKVAFWIEKVTDAPLYAAQFYQKYPEVMYIFKGKPLLLINGFSDGWRPTGGAVKPLPSGAGGLDGFTVRWMWGLLGPGAGSMWTFKEPSPPKPYVHAGANEQIGMTFATQGTYMTTPAGRQCRNGGKFFESQVANVRKHRPEVVTITGYNEWMAINFGAGAQPQFVDLFGPECSHDIEPMTGGHGSTYFQQAKRVIAQLKAG